VKLAIPPAADAAGDQPPNGTYPAGPSGASVFIGITVSRTDTTSGERPALAAE